MGIFNQVSSGVKVRRTPFPFYERTMFDCNMGELVPVFRKQMVPTDIFKMSNNVLVRFMPMFAPEYTEINMYVHYFFVPYRLLAKYFPEKYGSEEELMAIITGGEGLYDPETGTNEVSDDVFPLANSFTQQKHKFGDYLALPKGAALSNIPEYWADMYAIIYNEFYRNEVLQEKIDSYSYNDDLLLRNWSKDYLTSALPTQQKGIAPALPLSGETSALYEEDISATMSGGVGSHSHSVTATHGYSDLDLGMNSSGALRVSGSSDKTFSTSNVTPTNNIAATISKTALNANTVDFATAGTYDVSDVRNIFAIQRIMERANRCGSRYSEYIQANFGINPGDTRLGRPEYIGGTKTPIVVSQVLQNSATTSTSPQGNMAGHGIGYISDKVGTYLAREFGVVLGIASILPKSSYCQGIDKELTWHSRWEFFNPSFQNLSEQPVYNWEVYCDGTEADNAIFGFQGIYNELRCSHSHFCGSFTDNLDFWHLGRKFSERPTLSDAFLKCQPSETTRIFNGVDPTKYKNILVDFVTSVKSLRPMVKYPVPAYLDHN